MYNSVSGALAAGAGMATGAVIGKKVRNMKLEQNDTELQNLQAAADMVKTKELRKEMVTYKSSDSQKTQASGDIAQPGRDNAQQSGDNNAQPSRDSSLPSEDNSQLSGDRSQQTRDNSQPSSD